MEYGYLLFINEFSGICVSQLIQFLSRYRKCCTCFFLSSILLIDLFLCHPVDLMGVAFDVKFLFFCVAG
jgi:hypothetical protein